MLDKQFGGVDDVYYDCFYDMTDMTESEIPVYKQNFQKDNMISHIMAECENKQSCTFDIPNKLFYSMNSEMRDMLYLYAQVECTQSKATLQAKNAWGLAVACLGILTVFVYRATLEYIRSYNQINDRLIDLKLITVDDYSTESKIPRLLFEKFKIEVMGEVGPKQSPVHLFEEFMHKQIQTMMMDDNDRQLEAQGST